MNTNLVLILVGVVLLGGIVFYYTQSSDTPAAETANEGQSADEAATMDAQEGVEDFRGSMQELFALGRNAQCTFRYEDESGLSEGTFYVAASGQRLRGNFTYRESDGETFEGGMIHDNSMVYTWGDTPEGTFGMKMSVEETEAGSPYDSEAFENQPFDPSAEVEYDCAPWSVDASVFTPPSDVEFMDMNAQMQQMQEALEGGGGMDCSMCDSIPDESARAQCRESLQCE